MLTRTKQTVRFISIHTPASSLGVSVSKQTDQVQAPNELSLKSPQETEITLTQPVFNTINSSTLCATLPASLPLYVARGSIVGCYPSSSIIKHGIISNVSQWLAQVKSFNGIIYDKLISTEVSKIILTGNVSRGEGSFAIVDMDGSKDWVLYNGQLRLYAGEDISLSYLNDGLFRKLQIIKGRGLCGIYGKGDIVKVVLDQGEQFEVRCKELLALSSDNVRQLKLTKHRWNELPSPKEKEASATATTDVPEDAELSLWEKMRGYLKQVVAFGSQSQHFFARSLLGSGEYYTIAGPTTILLQSNHAGSGGFNAFQRLQARHEASQLSQLLESGEHLAKVPVHKTDLGSMGNLSVFSLENGRVTAMKTVKDFSEEVQRIAGLKK